MQKGLRPDVFASKEDNGKVLYRCVCVCVCVCVCADASCITVFSSQIRDIGKQLDTSISTSRYLQDLFSPEAIALRRR